VAIVVGQSSWYLSEQTEAECSGWNLHLHASGSGFSKCVELLLHIFLNWQTKNRGVRTIGCFDQTQSHDSGEERSVEESKESGIVEV
jgi:hypothetical protein